MTLVDHVLRGLPTPYRDACARWSGPSVVGYRGDEALAVQVAAAITRHFSGDPLLERYVRHLSPLTIPPRNTEPWHAMGERVYAALTLLSLALGDPRVTFRETALPAQRERQGVVAVGLAVKILRSQLYQWSTEMEHFAAAAPLPKHTISRHVLPQGEMFFSFETAWGMTNLNGEETGSRNWMLVTEDHRGASFSAIMDLSVGHGADGRVAISGNNFMYGKTFPTDFDGKTCQVAHRMLALLAFVNSPYVDTESGRLPRPLRREMQRQGHGDDEQTASVVKLRRRAVAQQASESADEAGRDYRHRWWVAGHHRAQWYSSEQAHHVIWIAPYLKGPAEAPLLEHLYSVVR